MARRHALVGVLLTFCAGSALARYVSLTPPPGWSSGGGAGGAYAAAAGAIGNAQASSAFTTGVTKVPAGMRYAAGASRIAARAIGLSPLGLGLAATAWLASNCLKVDGGKFVLSCGQGAPGGQFPSDGYTYKGLTDPAVGPVGGRFPTCDAAVASQIAYYNSLPNSDRYSNFGACTIFADKSGGYASGTVVDKDGHPIAGQQNVVALASPANCPAGWWWVDGVCQQAKPPVQVVSPAELEEKLAPTQLPADVPAEIPSVPLPLDLPIWLPHIIPMGDPIEIPNSNPKTYKQPGIKLTPSPAVGDPWRANAEPVETPTDSPTPVTGPQPIPGSGLPQPVPEEDPSMCEENPGILACEKLKLGTLTAQDVPNAERVMAITPDAGWGSSNAACPAPKNAQVSFGQVTFNYDPFCSFAAGIRPVVIALAWFLAACAFLGIGRKGD